MESTNQIDIRRFHREPGKVDPVLALDEIEPPKCEQTAGLMPKKMLRKRNTMHSLCSLTKRMRKEKTDHLATGIRSIGFGVGSIGTASGPGVAGSMDYPLF